jgi:hypothetical protein
MMEVQEARRVNRQQPEPRKNVMKESVYGEEGNYER